jgi:hypothetical protein
MSIRMKHHTRRRFAVCDERGGLFPNRLNVRWIAFMRNALLISLLPFVAIIVVACSKPISTGIPFEKAAAWLPREQASLQQLPPWMVAADHSQFLAVWTNGPRRRVYLDSANSIGSATILWHVYVFDDEDRLIDVSGMNAMFFSPESAYKPRRLLTISPLRVVFGNPMRDDSQEVVEAYSKDAWQEVMSSSERAYHITERARAEYRRAKR